MKGPFVKSVKRPSEKTRLILHLLLIGGLTETTNTGYTYSISSQALLEQYHSAWIAHLLEMNNVQGVIGYRRHTHSKIGTLLTVCTSGNPDVLVLLLFPSEICYDTGVKCKGNKVCRHFTGGFFR